MKLPQTDRNAAFLFPGIGIEMSTHEKMLYASNTPFYEPFFRESSEIVKRDLANALHKDRVPELGGREAQFFMYSFSAGTFQLCREHGLVPACTAGYSFGIYAALYAAGVISFSDGLAILDKAYELMVRCPGNEKTGMSAIIGLSLDEISAIIRKESLRLIHHSNSNNEFCHIFCGDREELASLNRRALEADAINAVDLAVSLPYHHQGYSRYISEPFRSFCDTVTWRTPSCPVFSTVDFKPLVAPQSLKEYVVNHLTTPINWYKTIMQIYNEPVTLCIECGPGITLTQNARFCTGTVKWLNSKNLLHRLNP